MIDFDHSMKARMLERPDDEPKRDQRAWYSGREWGMKCCLSNVAILYADGEPPFVANLDLVYGPVELLWQPKKGADWIGHEMDKSRREGRRRSALNRRPRSNICSVCGSRRDAKDMERAGSKCGECARRHAREREAARKGRAA